MGARGIYMATTAIMSVTVLVNILEVDSATNLEMKGNQVFGESFHLECSTRTINIANYASFERSTYSGRIGTRVGYREFYPNLRPSCREKTNLVTNYTVSCNSDGSVFTLTIPANNTIEHKTYWRCQTNTDTNVLENNVINIFIIVPITGISMIRPPITSNNTVSVIPDQPITFKCQTTQGRPEATVTWYFENAPLSGGTTTTTPVSGDIVTTTGSLTLTLNRTSDYKVISCRATNYVNMEPVESTEKPVIRVKYAPSGPPVIVGYSNGTVYRTIIGRPQSVTCQVPTAHPVPTLSWSCPSYTMTGTALLPVYTAVVSSSITWTIKSTEPGQTCQCTSYQEMSGHVTTYVNIDVLYPPRITGNDATVPEHSTVTLTCSAEGVPATYTFYNWTHGAPDNVTVLRSLPGTYHSTTTTLTLSDVNYQDTGYYTCNVSNGIQDYITGTSSISVDVTLTVRSRPIVTGRQTLSGSKGDNIKMSVEFYSNNASPPNMLWYRADECPPRNISGSRFETSLTTSTVDLQMYGQTVQLPGFNTSLTVKHSQEFDVINYTCEVVNDVGTTSVDIALLQEGPPEEPLLIFAGATQEGDITVIWQTGNNRGHEQKVNIVFKLSDNAEWTQYTTISEADTAYHLKNGFYVTTIDLQPGVYTIGLYARNELGHSDTVNKTNIGIQGRTITGPVIGAVLGGIVIGILVVLGTLYLRGHWRDKGHKEDKTQSSSENQLSTGDQGTPVYTNLELTVTPHVEQGQQYQDLTPNRSASTSEYQTLDITDTVVPDLDS